MTEKMRPGIHKGCGGKVQQQAPDIRGVADWRCGKCLRIITQLSRLEPEVTP